MREVYETPARRGERLSTRRPDITQYFARPAGQSVAQEYRTDGREEVFRATQGHDRTHNYIALLIHFIKHCIFLSALVRVQGLEVRYKDTTKRKKYKKIKENESKNKSL